MKRLEGYELAQPDGVWQIRKVKKWRKPLRLQWSTIELFDITQGQACYALPGPDVGVRVKIDGAYYRVVSKISETPAAAVFHVRKCY